MTNLKEANNDNFLADTYINSNQTVSKTFLAYQLISKCSDEDFEAAGMSALQREFLLRSLEIADLPNPYDGDKEFEEQAIKSLNKWYGLIDNLVNQEFNLGWSDEMIYEYSMTLLGQQEILRMRGSSVIDEEFRDSDAVHQLMIGVGILENAGNSGIEDVELLSRLTREAFDHDGDERFGEPNTNTETAKGLHVDVKEGFGDNVHLWAKANEVSISMEPDLEKRQELAIRYLKKLAMAQYYIDFENSSSTLVYKQSAMMQAIEIIENDKNYKLDLQAENGNPHFATVLERISQAIYEHKGIEGEENGHTLTGSLVKVAEKSLATSLYGLYDKIRPGYSQKLSFSECFSAEATVPIDGTFKNNRRLFDQLKKANFPKEETKLALEENRRCYDVSLYMLDRLPNIIDFKSKKVPVAVIYVDPRNDDGFSWAANVLKKEEMTSLKKGLQSLKEKYKNNTSDLVGLIFNQQDDGSRILNTNLMKIALEAAKELNIFPDDPKKSILSMEFPEEGFLAIKETKKGKLKAHRVDQDDFNRKMLEIIGKKSTDLDVPRNTGFHLFPESEKSIS